MLKKKFRLESPRKINITSTINSGLFILKTSKAKENFPKFAFIISKKIDKRAVVRNKIKRILSKAIEENLERFKENNIVIIVKKTILDQTKEEIRKQLLEDLEKNKLTK